MKGVSAVNAQVRSALVSNPKSGSLNGPEIKKDNPVAPIRTMFELSVVGLYVSCTDIPSAFFDGAAPSL